MRLDGAPARLPGYLAGLKRRGGRLLVVGTDGHGRLCRRLHGADGGDHRRVVVAGPDEGLDSATPSVAAEARLTAHDGAADGVRLARLARDTVNEIDGLAAAGLSPAQLRVCVESVDSLRQVATLAECSLFLDAVLDRTRAARGLAHAHLRAPYESDTVRRLEPQFDAVVEVRTTPAPAQRWHLPDPEPDSDWLPLDTSRRRRKTGTPAPARPLPPVE